MKDNGLKKQTDMFVMLSSFFAVFMVVSVVASNFRFKPTYSADENCTDCPTIRYEYGPTPPAGTKCYGCEDTCTGSQCEVSSIISYVYEVSAEKAKSALHATGSCSVVNDGYCADACNQACYSCKKSNGNIMFLFAESEDEAKSASSGTSCERTSLSDCVEQTQPGERNCYECTKNNIKNYVYATSKENAASTSGGTNCAITSAKNCETVPTTNPKTGTTAIVVAWIVGIFAIGYSIWYFAKSRAIR